MFYKTEYKSPLRNITLCCDEKENLAGLWFEGQKYFAAGVDDAVIKNDDLKIFKDTKKWLDKYFSGKKPDIKELPLKPIGTEFRQDVWKILCKIPYGKVITYGDIAKQIAILKGTAKMSARAVAGAVGHNPISIIIPCHRVVGSNGNLTGYAGGIKTKIKLLELEGIKIKNLSILSRRHSVFAAASYD